MLSEKRVGLGSAPPGLGPGRLELCDAERRDDDTLGDGGIGLRRTGTDAVHVRLPGASTGDTPKSGKRLWRGAQKNRRSPVGDERCPARGTTPLRGFLAEPALVCTAMDAMQRLNNGSRSARLDHPPPPTQWIERSSRSGRSSEVLSSGASGPASQQPRFSCPSPPGTCPHHRFAIWLLALP